MDLSPDNTKLAEPAEPNIERVLVRKVLSIDPSVNTVGFATLQLFDNDEQIWSWGMWKLEGYNLLQRCADLRAYIQQTDNADFTDLILEWPTFYQSEKGEVAAKQSDT